MPEQPPFSEEIDSYKVLKLVLADYRGTNRPTRPEAQFASQDIGPEVRRQAKRLLRTYFRRWATPYNGRLPGWRKDSPIYLLWQGQLACGVYLCDQNEFGREDNWGQLHYAFADPRFKGKGLYSLVFREAVRRAQSWGLTGIYLSSDRHMLPEVYERWGAVPWKEIPKSFVYPEHEGMGAHNWLVYKIHDRMLAKLLSRYASGVLVDIGCGTKPYASMTKDHVVQYIGVAHAEMSHPRENVDVFASVYDTMLPDASADTVLCTAVIAHLERPKAAFTEMRRILKPGGHLILSAPLFWHVQDEPRDFYRFTIHGLEYLLGETGFQKVEVLPLSGFVVTFSQEFCYFLEEFRRWYSSWLIHAIQSVVQRLAFRLSRRDRSYRFTWMYLVVATKVDAGSQHMETA